MLILALLLWQVLQFLIFFYLLKSWRQLSKEFFSLLISGFLVVSLLLIYPRFSFFHFQLSLAFVVILSVYLFSKAKVSYLPFAIYYLLAVIYIIRPVLVLDWRGETRFWNREDLVLAQDISNNVAKNETVFLLGLQSGIYAMADRLPPKPWTDNFGWYLEIPQVQEEIINRWDKNPPDKIIWQDPTQRNWYDLGTYQPKEITKWITQNYTKKSEIEKGVWIWQKKD